MLTSTLFMIFIHKSINDWRLISYVCLKFNPWEELGSKKFPGTNPTTSWHPNIYLEHLNVRNVYYHWIMSERAENVTSSIYVAILSGPSNWFPTKRGRNERASILQSRHHSLTLITHARLTSTAELAAVLISKWVWIGSSLNRCG